jgi:2-polyprenyl-3-methyl-5-hydroxy-6-metoxy-1,4-benzoquinol methylase
VSLVRFQSAASASSKMIEIAKEKAADQKIKNTFSQTDILTKNIKKAESYDRILAFIMLHTHS